MMLTVLLARFAVGHAAGEPLFFQVLQTSRIVGKLTIEVIDCVP
jgi:hypothetical protein